MRKEYLHIVMALVLGGLFTAAVASESDTIQELATAQTTAPVEQQLKKIQALGLLNAAGENGFTMAAKTDSWGKDTGGVGSAALHATEKGLQTFLKIGLLLEQCRNEQREIYTEWINNCAAPQQEILRRELRDIRAKQLENLAEELKRASEAEPVQAAITAANGQESEFAATFDHIVDQLKKAAKKQPKMKFEETDDGATLSGNLRDILMDALPPNYADDFPEQMNRISEAADATFCLRASKGGNYATISLGLAREGIVSNLLRGLSLIPGKKGTTTLPADWPTLPANAEEPLLVVYSTPQMRQILQEVNRESGVVMELRKTYRLFEALGKADTAQASAYADAQRGAKTLENFFSQTLPKAGHADSLILARGSSGEMWLQMKADDSTVQFRPGELCCMELLGNKGTVLYAEGTELHRDASGQPHAGEIAEAVQAIARGIALPMDSEKSDEYTALLAPLQNALPNLLPLFTSLHDLSNQLFNNSAFVVGDTEIMGSAPHVGLRHIMQDPAALQQTFRQITDGIRALFAMGGENPQVVDQALATVSEKTPTGANRHRLIFPLLSIIGEPQMLVKDKVMALSNSSQLADSMMTPSGKIPFCGAAAVLNIPNLKKLIHRYNGENSLLLSSGSMEHVFATITTDNGTITLRLLVK